MNSLCELWAEARYLGYQQGPVSGDGSPCQLWTISLLLPPGGSCSISQLREVYNVTGFLQKEGNLLVNGPHFYSNLQGWR